MGLGSFWTSITGPRVREIAPAKNRSAANDGRPATSSGVRTIRRTPSLDDDDGDGVELNRVESLLTKNVIEPPPPGVPTNEEKKARRRSRGLSLSGSKTVDGVKRRRSLFGGKKDAEKDEPVPEVPTLPTLSAIYSRQAPHHMHDSERPSTAVSAIASPTSPRFPSQASASTTLPTAVSRPPPSTAVTAEVFELPAEVPVSGATATAPAKADIEVKKNRRRSLGEVLSGKRSKSVGAAEFHSRNKDVPPMPAVVREQAATAVSNIKQQESKQRSRRNSNASVASKASKLSRKSRRKSWWQRGKNKDEGSTAMPPIPGMVSGHSTAQISATQPLGNTNASIPLNTTTTREDDTASIRTTRTERSTARRRAPSIKSVKKQRPVSSASQVRRKRRSWWASSNPDDSDDDSNPLPPIPLLIRSPGTTPGSSPSNSESGSSPPGPTKASVPVRSISTKSYTPRSAAKSFLVSTTPVADDVRKSVRHSLHAGGEDLDAGFENDRGTYCLSAEQQKEWEKLKHLMAVMDRRREAQRKTFGEASVADLFPAAPKGFAGDSPPVSVSVGGAKGAVVEQRGEVEERRGVKYSNRSALAALEVGVAK